MTTTTEFQLVDINKLVPYANNARTHNKEQILKLRSSLREFGFVNPVIIDREYNVLAGHGRIMAATSSARTGSMISMSSKSCCAFASTTRTSSRWRRRKRSMRARAA